MAKSIEIGNIGGPDLLIHIGNIAEIISNNPMSTDDICSYIKETHQKFPKIDNVTPEAILKMIESHKADKLSKAKFDFNEIDSVWHIKKPGFFSEVQQM